MWFSYPREESWVPIPIDRVKEIQKMNRDGVLPADLGEIVEIETKPVKILDYENVVGQDSLTRLDERRNIKKKNKSRNKNNKPNNSSENALQRVDGNVTQTQQAPNTPVARPANSGDNNNRNKNFRPNRNNPNRPDRNKGGQQDKLL